MIVFSFNTVNPREDSAAGTSRSPRTEPRTRVASAASRTAATVYLRGARGITRPSSSPAPTNLNNIINGKSDVIGYAVAINGKISSADVYVSNAVLKQLWPKMLKASATEAVSESRGVRLADPVKASAVKDFIDDSERAASRDQALSAGASLRTREDKDNVMFETRDEK